jgi:hypothetical protein
MEVLTQVRKTGALFQMIVLLVALGAPVMSAEAPEYQVKAAMLYNFALFVEWPPEAFATDTSPLVVCVLGADPFGQWLDYELGGTYVGTHPLEIRRTPDPGEASRCHIVFAGRSEEARMQNALAGIGNASVLTVSDSPDTAAFCRRGGMVAFMTQDNRIRFALNTEAMTKAGLKSDSRLKRMATTAECGEGQ